MRFFFLNVGDIDAENPGKDDFELWSPSEDRPEQCLFGRQVGYSPFIVIVVLLMSIRHFTIAESVKLTVW